MLSKARLPIISVPLHSYHLHHTPFFIKFLFFCIMVTFLTGSVGSTAWAKTTAANPSTNQRASPILIQLYLPKETSMELLLHQFRRDLKRVTQLLFRSRQSPFKLPKPKKELDKREKAGIEIGVMAGVALLAIGGSIGWSYWKKRKAAGTLNHDNTDLTPDEQPPAYTRRTKQ